MKCIKCGNEFTGYVCPHCGQKYAPLKCPTCGKTREPNARFCSACGYDFLNFQPHVPQNTQTDTDTKINELPQVNKTAAVKFYSILKYVPAVLFIIFSVLLFGLYAAPVAVMPGGELMGESIPAESYGSVYSLMEDLPELKGTMIALIVLACIALIYAVFMAVKRFAPIMEEDVVHIKDREVEVNLILACISQVLLFVFFVIGCVICGQIAAADGGMGIVAAGSGPILIIVFSLLFLILSTGAIIFYVLIRKKIPTIVQNELRLAEYIKEHPAPKKPLKPKKPKAPELKAINRYIRMKKITKSILWTIIIGGIWAAIASAIITNIRLDMQLQFILLILPIAIIVFIMVIYIILSCLPIKKHKINNIRKSASVILFGILFFFLSLSCLIAGIRSSVSYLNDNYYNSIYTISIPLLIGFLILLAIGILYFIATHKLKRKVLVAIYGEEKPPKNAKPKITGEQLDEEQKKFKQIKAMGKERKEKYNQQYAEYRETRKNYLQDIIKFKKQLI